MESDLNKCQRIAYNIILNSTSSNVKQSFFMDDPGDSGKTYLYKALLAKIRTNGHIALVVASSSIATLLLPGGRTAHSRFKIPLHVHETSTCNISKQSHLASLIRSASLIIWDEAPMASRYIFEVLDKTLKDISLDIYKERKQQAFGGKVFILGGDF